MKPQMGRGDDGRTELMGGERVGKDSPRVEAAGAVDELNCAVGLARVVCADEPLRSMLASIQHDLFVVGGDLAMGGDSPARDQLVPVIAAEHTGRLERWMEELAGPLPALRSFILPDGCELAARLHLARAVCRRAERAVVALAGAEPRRVAGAVLAYLNRLGDVLFVASRWANHRAGVPDAPWIPRRNAE